MLIKRHNKNAEEGEEGTRRAAEKGFLIDEEIMMQVLSYIILNEGETFGGHFVSNY